MNVKPEYRDDHKIYCVKMMIKEYNLSVALDFFFMRLEFLSKGCFTSLFIVDLKNWLKRFLLHFSFQLFTVKRKTHLKFLTQE